MPQAKWKNNRFTKKTDEGFIISNAIYKEVLPRDLTSAVQDNFLSLFKPEWINEDKSRICRYMRSK